MNADDTDGRAQLLAAIERCYEDAAQRRVAHIHEPRPTLGDVADAILAAGFGNVAQAKAEAARDERIVWALYLWGVVEDSMEDAVSVHDKAIDEAFQAVAGYLIANIARGVTIEDASWGLSARLIKTARRMTSLKRENPASEHHEIDAVLARAAEYRTPSANGGGE